MTLQIIVTFWLVRLFSVFHADTFAITANVDIANVASKSLGCLRVLHELNPPTLISFSSEKFPSYKTIADLVSGDLSPRKFHISLVINGCDKTSIGVCPDGENVVADIFLTEITGASYGSLPAHAEDEVIWPSGFEPLMLGTN
jgi:hypothetical protein